MYKDKALSSPEPTLLPDQEWADRKWVASYLGVHRATVIRMEKSPTKNFPRPIRFGKSPVFNVEEVRQWAMAQREKA